MGKGNGSTATVDPPKGDTDAPAAATPPMVKIERLRQGRIEVPIIGLSPLIPHKWSEKSLHMMREKQSGKTARPKHTPKVPEEEAEAATYRLDSGAAGMPATAFKAAMVGATRFFEGVTMVLAKQSFFVEGEGVEQLVEIVGDAEIREDTPRNSNGVADLRYRNYYHPWSAVLPITFLPTLFDLESVLALVDAAGNGGVGDWRPSAPKSASGTFGRFMVDESVPIDIREVR